MEAGRWRGENADLVTAMIGGADKELSDEEVHQLEQCACPGCGSCSGMFTANSMKLRMQWLIIRMEMTVFYHVILLRVKPSLMQ